jgi:hypothetical protein
VTIPPITQSRRTRSPLAAFMRLIRGHHFGLLLAFATFAAVLPWLLGAASSADATHAHPSSDGQHIESLHYYTWEMSGTMGEDICAQSYDTGAVSTATWLGYLQVLYNQGWDGTGGGRLDNYFTAYSCESYDLSTASWIDVRASLVADASAYGCQSYSCVNFTFPIYYGGTLLHHHQGRLWIRTDHITGSSDSRISTINHEFGHVLGLLDPPIGGPCGTKNLMHQYTVYGCSSGYILWPTDPEKASVVNNTMAGQ